MRCVECPCYYWDDYEEMEICHADPNWPAPCEYNDSMMKAIDTRYYYNADENLCADEDFVIYFLCGMEGLTAEEAREGLHTKREFYGWFDTTFRCKEDIHNEN